MATGSVQLYETASAKSDASGHCTIKFNLPHVNRVWQGTIQALDSPAGTLWAVSFGGNTFGNLYAPGPFGPIQVLPSQQVTMKATGLTASTLYSAILIGVNDPIDNPTPYTGPTSVTSVTLEVP